MAEKQEALTIGGTMQMIISHLLKYTSCVTTLRNQVTGLKHGIILRIILFYNNCNENVDSKTSSYHIDS